MAVSNDFLQFVLDQLSGWGNVKVKHMFGGAALYHEALAFGMIANNMVYLKVDDTNRNKYLEKESIQLKPFKNHATVLSYYSIPPDVLEDRFEFVKWANESYSIQMKHNNH